MLDCSEIVSESKTQSIEKILHKYEMEIRSHIKLEQEFKKMADDSERRLETLKVEFNSLVHKYNEMMLKLSDLSYINDTLTDENRMFRNILKENQIEFEESNKRSAKNRPLSGTRDKHFKNNRTTSTEFLKMQVAKLKKTSCINASVCAPIDKNAGSCVNATKKHAKHSEIIRQQLEHQ